MKNIIYIITGCFILGIGTIKAYDTITEAKLAKAQTALNKAQTELNKAQTRLDSSKNAYWDCLEYLEHIESEYDCSKEYDNVNSAYDNLNNLNNK